MIRGLHGMFHSSDAGASRAFFRDVLRLPFTDVGGGWLIFDLAETDVGIHPSDDEPGSRPGTHSVSFFCDDIRSTMAELRARGVRFKHEPEDHGYGYVTYFEIPGGIEVQLYEAKYRKRAAAKPKAKARPKAAKAKPKGAGRAAKSVKAPKRKKAGRRR